MSLAEDFCYSQAAHFHNYKESDFHKSLAAVTSLLPNSWSPEVAIICGSGLGSIADDIAAVASIDYKDIPNFSKTSVQGHSGKLVFGELVGKKVVCMVGRFHSYEGLASYETTFPVRLFSMLQVKVLITTNAAGSLNHENFPIGSIMVIKDHINLPGLIGHSPLMGKNLDMFGPRFPALSDAYDLELRRLILSKLEQIKHFHGVVMKQGVYTHVSGPTYETPAEANFLRIIGADAVGMSTVPEVLVARHCGMRVLGLSLITNLVLLPKEIERIEAGEEIHKATHEEVLLSAKNSTKIIQKLLELTIGSMKL